MTRAAAGTPRTASTGRTRDSRVPPRIESELLRRIIATASGRLDLTETVQPLAGLITEVTGSDVCFVHVLDHERARLVLTGATPPFDRHAGAIELAVGEGVAGWVAQNAEPVVVRDKWADHRYKYIPELRGDEYVSFASVPMVARAGHVVGVINVHARAQDHFREGDVSILADIANLMADSVENARLHTRLAQREAELERFAEHTLELQESERQRLAAEIHDGISQRIVSLSYHLWAAADSAPRLREEVLAEIETAQFLAGAALEEARAAISGLRPPLLDDLGLAACLRGLAGELPETIERVVDVSDDARLDSHVEVAIYRMAQEILQNVVKHAQAHLVSVALEPQGSGCTLSIADDGVGFDAEEMGSLPGQRTYGLSGLRARAALIGATVELASARGKGTTVSVRIPDESGRTGGGRS